MTHLLDTNICSAYLKRPGGLAHRFIQHVGGLTVSTIVLSELFTWAYRRAQPEPLLKLIEESFVDEMRVLDFDSGSARIYGQTRAELLEQGQVVNPVDLMIASVAIQHDLVLVTHNLRHFEVIPGLKLDDWIDA